MKGPQIPDGLEADDAEAGLVRELLRGTIGGGTPSTSEHTGTKALMLAVLEDGLRAFLDPEKGVRDEAERWMRSRREIWVFSFVTVCTTLGLEPDAVRSAAYRMRQNNLSPRHAIGRNRQNVRHFARLSGDDRVAVYLEVDESRIAAYVRDRGSGFDPADVPPDRKGIAESIVGRMQRHGGTAAVTTAPGEGTEIELLLPRQPAREPARPEAPVS